MTVPVQTPINRSAGNGVTTVFPYSFKIASESDIEVSVDGVVKTLTTDYTVSGVGNNTGGNVTFVAAPANGTTVVRRRQMEIKRDTDYQDQGEMPASTVDDDVDAVVMMAQQLEEEIDRALTLPVGTSGVSAELPIPSPSRFLGWNSAGDAIENYTGAADVPVSIAMTPVVASSTLDAARQLLGAAAASNVREDVASAATLNLDSVTSDYLRITGTTTVTAVTLSAGQRRIAVAGGAFQLTNSVSLIVQGGANYTTTAGDLLLFFGESGGVVRVYVLQNSGSAYVALTGNQTIAGIKTFSSMPVFPIQSMVRLNTDNGFGSTNTAIRRFSNVVTNQGSDITYSDSAANGASFTINTAGVYSVSYSASWNTAGDFGISLNSSQLTTAIRSITAADILQLALTAASGYPNGLAWSGYLPAGSVIRAHAFVSATASTANGPALFTISRVG